MTLGWQALTDRLRLPASDRHDLPSSPSRFPDGGQYRVEILPDLPLDLYVEGPDGLGGFVRHHEVGEIVRIGAPVYLKFGLRNAPNIYPSGLHLEPVAVATARERVRRAAIGLEHLQRAMPEAVISPLGAADLGVPVWDRSP